MLYRDFMQKFRPLYAPDGVGGGAGDGATAVAASGTTADAAAPSAGAPDAAPAAAAPAAAETAAPGADALAATTSTPSLLEAATGKPAKEAAAPAAEAGVTDPAKDAPAPADAAKTEAEKAAEAEAAKPKTEAELKAEAEAAKATDPATKDATAEAQPPAPIKYEAFKLPEDIKFDEERLGKFSEYAGNKQIDQETAQGFLDLHIEEMQRFATEVQKQAADEQRKVWNTLNDTWKTEMRKDPEIGGNRIDTSLSRAKAVIEEYLGPEHGGSPELVQSLLAHTSNNGMGNFPPFVRLLNKIGEVLNVFEEGTAIGNLNPAKPQKGPGNRGWYNNMPGAAQG